MFPHFTGYATPLVAKPGERLTIRASASPARTVQTRIVRLACLNTEPSGPPERIEPAGFGYSGPIALKEQTLDPGSHLEAALPAPVAFDTLTIGIAVMPTLGDAAKTLIALGNDGRDEIALLRAADGRCALAIGARTICSSIELPLHAWSLLSVTINLTRHRATLFHRAVAPGMPPHRQGQPRAETLELRQDIAPVAVRHVRIAASAAPNRRAFDGRIDLPILLRGERNLLTTLLDENAESELASDPDLICAFSFRASQHSIQTDLSPAAIRAVARHHPLAAVKGVRWTGETHDRRLKPAHYSALHFNSDALTDAGWCETLSVNLPSDLASGVYALEMIDDAGQRAFATFFVSAATAMRGDVAFLAPTFTYLAYANAPETKRGPQSAHGLLPAELQLDRTDGALGRSIYERFRDHSGVVVTGERKPLLSIGPDFRLWGLPADSLLTNWLDQNDVSYDLITDHDLHALGEAALDGVRVLITGSHPEYWSTRMWDALSAWLAQGGRLVYLGGNGFYYRTAVAADGAIEVRRAEDGTRPFIGEPGEYVHAFSDEVGGLWRRVGRPPQALTGVGMAAQGFGRSTYYRKKPDAFDPAVAFVFEGVPDQSFGRGGLMGGGASGYEIDRFDTALGSDPNSWVLATSEDHAPDMLRTKEELLSYMPPFRDEKARSDMILAVNSQDGAVFAVGSIAWIGSVADTASDGTAARITLNVIGRLRDPSPLPRRHE